MIPDSSCWNNIIRGGTFARLSFSCHLFALLIFAFPAYGATTITLEAESGGHCPDGGRHPGPIASGGAFVQVPQGAGTNPHE